MLPCLTQDAPRSQVSESVYNDNARWSFFDNGSEILHGMGQLLQDQLADWTEPSEVLPTNECNMKSQPLVRSGPYFQRM